MVLNFQSDLRPKLELTSTPRSSSVRPFADRHFERSVHAKVGDEKVRSFVHAHLGRDASHDYLRHSGFLFVALCRPFGRPFAPVTNVNTGANPI